MAIELTACFHYRASYRISYGNTRKPAGSGEKSVFSVERYPNLSFMAYLVRTCNEFFIIMH